MYEEERQFSWSNLFIKVIIALIIILFIVWLVSLSSKRTSSSTKVVVSDIFYENINTMSEAGKSYFTFDKLPKKVGDTKNVTLEELYKAKMLLTLWGQDGKECSAKKSYVSLTKNEHEYQMKVFLNCDDMEDYIIVNLGCKYCDNELVVIDTTNNNQNNNNNSNNNNSNNNNSNTNSNVGNNNNSNSNNNNNNNTSNNNSGSNTPVIITQYQYMKEKASYWGVWSAFSDWSTTAVTANNYRDVQTKVVSEEYTYYTSGTTPPECKKYVEDYHLAYRNGFTCNYVKKVTSTTDYTLTYYGSGSGESVPADTSTYHYVQETANLVYSCNSGNCGMHWHVTYTIYKKVYTTYDATTTRTATCPAPYVRSGSTCRSDSIPQTGTRNVTYYRYRTRNYINGNTDYVWSYSNHDTELINSGYRLTSVMRERVK